MAKIKLSKPQQIVIDALISNNKSFIYTSSMYHWNKVMNDKKVILQSVWKPTVEKLINIKAIIPYGVKKYILNPDFKIIIQTN